MEEMTEQEIYDQITRWAPSKRTMELINKELQESLENATFTERK